MSCAFCFCAVSKAAVALTNVSRGGRGVVRVHEPVWPGCIREQQSRAMSRRVHAWLKVYEPFKAKEPTVHRARSSS